MNNVTDLIKKHESLRLYCYDDANGARLNLGDKAKGKPTIGYGHTGPDILPGTIISEAEADSILEHDIINAESDCNRIFGRAWPAFGQVRRAAFTDMAFNVGRTGISEFQLMIRAALDGDWPEVARQALSSKWAGEVHSRADDDAMLLETGEWLPEPPPKPGDAMAT
jgi:lysozyme